MTTTFIWQPAGEASHELYTEDGIHLGTVGLDMQYVYGVACLPDGLLTTFGARSIEDAKERMERFWVELAKFARQALPEPTVTAMEGLR